MSVCFCTRKRERAKCRDKESETQIDEYVRWRSPNSMSNEM